VTRVAATDDTRALTSMHVETGGTGQPLLILLHGLGATGAVWRPFLRAIEGRWPGRWLVVDLPGHGASAPANQGYSIDAVTAMLAEHLCHYTSLGDPPVILGHSFGGVLGLALASGTFGIAPRLVCALGIKCVWSEADLLRMAQLAAQPVRYLSDEAAAWERYLKVTGLSDLVAPDSPVLARGVAQQGEAWRLAMDPKANGSGRPPVADLIGAGQCPLYLARGGCDALVTAQHLGAMHASALDLGAYGHNVMVESPVAVWNWVASCLHDCRQK
jgi:pimeloyl-ACP methyl ester carboxylesterase